MARVGVRNGRAVGVELEDGTRIGARAVVSGAHPQTTYLDLVGGGAPPGGDRPKDPPVPDPLGEALIAISPSVGYLERAWDAKYGRVSSEPYIGRCSPTVFEPEPAPAGKHIALCFCRFASMGNSGCAKGCPSRPGQWWLPRRHNA